MGTVLRHSEEKTEGNAKAHRKGENQMRCMDTCQHSKDVQ